MTQPNFQPSQDNMVTDTTDTSFTDDTVSAGTTYYYQVYAVSPRAITFVDQTSVTTPGEDRPLEPISDTSSQSSGGGGDITQDAPSSSTAPTNVNAAGINDLEILVSWTNNASHQTGFAVAISTDQVHWFAAGKAQPDATNFIVRGTGATGEDFLQENTTYYIRVAAINDVGSSSWSNTTSASVKIPDVNIDQGHDIIVVCGGNRQPITYLLKGVSVGPNGELQGGSKKDSVGWIWFHDVNEGYNAFLTADPADGGAPRGNGMPPFDEPADATNDILNNDGTGRLYKEIQYEWGHGIYNVGLIGYSHGGGMMGNLSRLLRDNDPNPLFARVVFAATIDAVQYGSGPDAINVFTPNDGYYLSGPLTISPALIWSAPGVNITKQMVIILEDCSR
jgi:hypothetical protein